MLAGKGREGAARAATAWAGRREDDEDQGFMLDD